MVFVCQWRADIRWLFGIFPARLLDTIAHAKCRVWLRSAHTKDVADGHWRRAVSIVAGVDVADPAPDFRTIRWVVGRNAVGAVHQNLCFAFVRYRIGVV